jgi:AcrR family transcriptional regulator
MNIQTKPAAQRRSQEKQDRLVDALEELLRQKPFDQITIANIASQADVSPATIYQRFNNRDAAVSILMELYYRRVREWTRSPEGRVDTSAAPDLYSALMMIGRSAWMQVDTLEHVMRPAYLYSRLRPDLVGPTWDQMEKIAIGGFRGLLSQFEAEVDCPDPEKAAGSIFFFFNLMMLGRLLHSESDAEFLSNGEDFAQQLADFAYGYLKGQR